MSPRRKSLTPNDERHGSTRGFWAGCRKPCCRDAWNDYQRQHSPHSAPKITDELTVLGFLRRCSCGHTSGEHSVPKLGHPQPCDICDCKDLDRPEVKEIRFPEGPSDPLAGARRLA